MTMIFQYITIYITIFLSLIFGCNPDNVTAKVNDTVTSETQSFTVTVKNETRGIVGHSSTFITAIEKKSDDKWFTAGAINSVLEDSMMFYPTVEKTYTIYLSHFGIEHLSVGDYRLVLHYHSEGPRVSYAYFTVTE